MAPVPLSAWIWLLAGIPLSVPAPVLAQDEAAEEATPAAPPAEESAPAAPELDTTVLDNALSAIDAIGRGAVPALEAKKAEYEEQTSDPPEGFQETLDHYAGVVVGYIGSVLFFDPVRPFKIPSLSDADRAALKSELAVIDTWVQEGGAAAAKAAAAKLGASAEKLYDFAGVKLVVLWLIFAALFFTVRMGLINLRGFRHAVNVVRGKYDNPEEHGEVSHFQALSAALSATVGLGNIAGVAVAVNMGGPGAVFWMVMAGLFGMSSKFVECTLGQRYRSIDSQGRVSGGAMHYLSRGLSEMRMAPLGKLLAVLFVILCIGGSLGGGNMFQANQSLVTIKSAFGVQKETITNTVVSQVYGMGIACLVALVIIGGVRRIAATAARIVPAMCALYVLTSLLILLINAPAVPEAFSKIITLAFSTEAVTGGAFGVLLVGVQRAAFSNEAGIGSAAIAHAAARTEEPVREGIVALLEPFIDTVVVCTMTGLVVVVTGAWEGSSEGAAITSKAFQAVGENVGPGILAAATALFAFSTMISWSYYGERCWVYLFGDGSSLVYKIIFVVFVYIGALISLKNVIEFSDMMILGMAFPNLLGCLLLSGKVRRELSVYWDKYRRGEFKTFK